MMSAHEIVFGVNLILAEGSVPADLTMMPCRFLYIASAVGLRQQFLLQTNNIFNCLTV